MHKCVQQVVTQAAVMFERRIKDEEGAMTFYHSSKLGHNANTPNSINLQIMQPQQTTQTVQTDIGAGTAESRNHTTTGTTFSGLQDDAGQAGIQKAEQNRQIRHRLEKREDQ